MTVTTKRKKRSYIKILLRAVLDVLLIFLALLGPWWLALAFAIVLILALRSYEAVLGGVILDILYAGTASSLPFGDFLYTSLLLILGTVSWFISRYVRNMFGT